MPPAAPPALTAKMRRAVDAARAGRAAEALKLCEAILAAAPAALEPRLLRAQIAASAGRPGDAIAELRRALRHHPAEARAWTPLGALAARHLGASDRDALAELAVRAGVPAPLLAQVRRTLAAPTPLRRAEDAIEAGDAERAVEIARAAAEARPDDAAAHAGHARALEAAGRAGEALEALDRRIAASPPGAIAPRADRALLLQGMGRLGEADALLRELIAAHPQEGGLYRLWATGARVAADEPLLAAMERLWAGRDVRQRAELGFALAKGLEDAGRHGEVFAVLHAANGAVAKAAPFDMEAELADVARWRAALSDLGQAAAGPGPVAGPAPIFVAGLPRSGTTLIERVLARGAGIEAGGELGLLAPHVLRHLPPGGPAAGPDVVRGIGAGYRAALSRRFGGAARVTDKSMQLWKILPLLTAALPEARTLVVRRDPRDVGLSIYQQYFAPGSQRFASDPRAIGRVLRLFDESVAHWRERAPDTFREISYDAFVDDPDAGAEDLAEAAGLPPGALAGPDASGGLVRTLSVAQARAPVHGRSSGRWRRYEAELAPLIEELER